MYNKYLKAFLMIIVILPTVWVSTVHIQSSNEVYCKSQYKLAEVSEEQILNRKMKQDKAKTIVLDAGHGGYDSGSIADGYYEKDITLDIVKKIGQKLEEHGYQVVYTRLNDERANMYVSEDLQQRVRIGEEANADLFISIHLNAFNDDTRGIETWASFDDLQSFLFAQFVQDNLANLNYSTDRGLKNQDNAPLYVLNNNPIPAVLIELGFISSNEDMDRLTEVSTQEAITYALLLAVESYMEI